MTTDTDLERRLSATLDHLSDQVQPGCVPTFSWQRDAAARTRNPALKRAAISGAGLVAAAAVVTAVATAATSGPTPTPPPGAHSGAPVGSPVPDSAPDSAPDSSSAGHRTAGDLLLAAAHSALRTGDVPLAAGQYRYVRTVGPAPTLEQYGPNGGDPKQVQPPAGSYTLDELWIPKDESDVWMRRQAVHGTSWDGQPDIWKGRCGDLYADAQDGPKGDACTRPGSFDDLTPAFVAALPRNASTLYALLHGFASRHLNPDKDHDVNSVLYRTVDDMLASGMVTNDLTATLYAVLSRIPGITVVDGVANADGVRGTGFELSTILGRGQDAAADTMTLIVDAQTGAYLGHREVGDGIDYLDAVSVGVADKLGVAGS